MKAIRFSGERGVVRRVDHGHATAAVSADDCVMLELHGSRMTGRFAITLMDDETMLDRLG